jgi:hypothetical protein
MALLYSAHDRADENRCLPPALLISNVGSPLTRQQFKVDDYRLPNPDSVKNI